MPVMCVSPSSWSSVLLDAAEAVVVLVHEVRLRLVGVDVVLLGGLQRRLELVEGVDDAVLLLLPRLVEVGERAATLALPLRLLREEVVGERVGQAVEVTVGLV